MTNSSKARRLTPLRDVCPSTSAETLIEWCRVAVRPGHPLAGRITCSVADLDDVRVLAHRRDQVPAEHDRVIAATHQAGITPRWRFARFVENALICADASNADAVVLTEPSTRGVVAAVMDTITELTDLADLADD